MDEVDERVLQALKANSRISNTELAEQVGLSVSSCWRRVRALEDRGIIAGYTVALDDAGMGLGFQAIVHVQLRRHATDEFTPFVRAMQAQEEIRSVYATTGQADYHLHVVCADIDAYNQFLEGFLFRMPAVASAQTNLILRVVK
ncbi:Lrp/AsnC family transcriptional regulator [Chachezhania antarctica]|uniref:Lrp/AsnC family transcriptional regulator n=1 Tax=Chachezhania antarctica TaxID=2340860 RepID=UPI001F089296|nr:Lrp/AsnC family transcriptional regulator [Chachezhania antarctica]|tara:strand:- start:2870 stop:3301 length:432 start_codon:yes stop_codon:yes gene_type:complete